MRLWKAILFFLLIPYGILFIGLFWLNTYIKTHFLWGITFFGADIRVIILGWFLAIGYYVLLEELDDYLQFKKWRRTWK